MSNGVFYKNYFSCLGEARKCQSQSFAIKQALPLRMVGKIFSATGVNRKTVIVCGKAGISCINAKMVQHEDGLIS